MEQRIRIGIDVGGTFTDFVLVDEKRGQIHAGKLLTTGEDPSQAITEGTLRLVEDASVAVESVNGIVHGTTLVTNIVIERKGAKVGLITTSGFRDSLQIGAEMRYDLYDLFFERPAPIVPRHLRRVVTERVDAFGAVLKPLDEDEVRQVARSLVQDGVEAIAICFLHSYRNGTHEQRAKELVQEICPGLPVCISSEVAPEIREYERGNTTCVNSYVQPLMERYLERLEQRLREASYAGSLHVMLSGGGITTLRAAREFPVRLIESGPAAGAIAAAYYSRLTESDHLISFDMGGTTAKMCLIDHGEPQHAHEFEAARVRRFRKGSGLPLKVPVIDLIEIGAGGGSLARIDQMGLMKVGPDSAGSNPGPICYNRGGTEPAVTDADLLLGYLSPDYFLGGEMKLNLEDVRNLIEQKVAKPLGVTVTEAAAGVHSIVNENMAAATQMYMAEKGRDPRRYAMIAFGGAGPVHAYGLAKLLKIKRIISPFGAGVTSALGFLVAAPAIDYVRSYVTRLDEVNWGHLNDLFAEMERDARSLLVESGATADEITIKRQADMRYVGQGFEINVPVPAGELGPDMLDAMRELFLDTYQLLFDRRVKDVAIEALTWRVSATAPVPNVQLNFPSLATGRSDPLKGHRDVHFPGSGYVSCAVYDRYALRAGTTLRGPAVVEERESTTVMGPDCQATVDQYLNLIIDID